MAAKFVLEKDPAGRFRFRLVSQGRVLATSESYTTKRAAQNAIASVKSGAASATVDDATQPATSERAPGRPAKAAKKRPGGVKKAVTRKPAAATSDAPSVARKASSGRKAGATKKASSKG
ncbi:MAG TPA: DUF1508 domain-containing protein [Acidimicrobiales bacterium]